MKKFFIVDNTNNLIWITCPCREDVKILKDDEIDSVINEIHGCFKNGVSPNLKYAITVIKKHMLFVMRVELISEDLPNPVQALLAAGFQKRKLEEGEYFRTGIVFEDFASFVLRKMKKA